MNTPCFTCCREVLITLYSYRKSFSECEKKNSEWIVVFLMQRSVEEFLSKLYKGGFVSIVLAFNPLLAGKTCVRQNYRSTLFDKIARRHTGA